MGTIFLHNLGLDQNGITNRVSHIFFTSLFGGFIGFGKPIIPLKNGSINLTLFLALIPMIVQERGVYYHEQAAGAYRSTSYAVSFHFPPSTVP